MNTSFKAHKISEDEKIWMKEVYQTENFDPKVEKVKLRNKLHKNFNPMNSVYRSDFIGNRIM